MHVPLAHGCNEQDEGQHCLGAIRKEEQSAVAKAVLTHRQFAIA
jgi:hypothetical protein